VKDQGLPVGRSLLKLLKGERTKRQCQDCGAEFEACWAVICNDCALKREEENAQAEFRAKQAAEEAQQKELIRQAHIPEMWKNTRFENSDTDIHPEIFTRAREYASNFTLRSPSLLFYSGNVGTGKTHLAVMIANHILHEKRISVLYLKARDLLINLRGLYAPNAEMTESDYLERVARVPLLILDDVGRDRYTDWVDGVYWTVFDRRLESQKPTIVTTNRAPDDFTGNGLESRIGYATLSRLLKMCDGLVFEVGGSDLR